MGIFEIKMEEQKYKIGMELVEETVGKIILCRTPNNIITLNGKLVYDDMIKEQVEEDKDLFLRWLEGAGVELDSMVGYHKDIPHNGITLGGAYAAFINNKLYVTGRSSSFGNINKNELEKCLSDSNINNRLYNL